VNNNLLEDIINEIENKIYIGKQLLENPGEKDGLQKLQEISEGNKNNWNYSIYSKYIDEKGKKNYTIFKKALF